MLQWDKMSMRNSRAWGVRGLGERLVVVAKGG